MPLDVPGRNGTWTHKGWNAIWCTWQEWHMTHNGWNATWCTWCMCAALFYWMPFVHQAKPIMSSKVGVSNSSLKLFCFKQGTWSIVFQHVSYDIFTHSVNHGTDWRPLWDVCHCYGRPPPHWCIFQSFAIFYTYSIHIVNSSSPGQNGHHFADDIFKCISLNEKLWVLIKISLKFVSKSPINNDPALV